MVVADSNDAPTPYPTPPAYMSTIATDDQNLACAIIKEISPELSLSFDDMVCIVQQTLSTILDLGTTSNLIMDQSLFWTYSESSCITVKMANHGKPSISG